jgi:hypothetical protein
LTADDQPIGPIADHATDPPASMVQTVARCLAILSAAAAVIHFAVADAHYQEYWAFGVFMVGAAIAQIAWSAVAMLRSSRWLWAVGAVINAGIVVVYVVTRTYGDVVGPTPHEVEPIGFGDAFCTGLEAVIALGCVGLLLARTDRIVRPRPAGWTVGATGAAMSVLLVVALLDGGSEMSMSMSADGDAAPPAADSAASTVSPPGMTMNMTQPSTQSGRQQAATVRLRTHSPAGAITMPSPTMAMPHGMKMASGPCTSTPSAVQQQAAVRLVNRSWTDAKKYRSLATAQAAGYFPITPTGRAVVHYINPAYYQKTLMGRPVLDPSQPQSLVYANTPQGAVLVATMFIMSPAVSPPPQPGGCLTQWHIHTNLCFKGAGVVAATGDGISCPPGSVNRITPPMLHVWFVPVPGGPTAVDAPDGQVVRAAERVPAPANQTA